MTDTKQIDWDKLEKVIQNVDTGQSVAFKENDIVDVEPNLESIKKNLNESDELFLDLGCWGYDDEFSEEPTYMIDTVYIDLTGEIDEYDSYYDKYHFPIGGYGIFVDNYYNIKFGYYTIEAPASGHGAGNTTFHDFKDAREDDVIKNKLTACIEMADIWE